MQSAKYQTEVDLSNENMSQSLLAQLVGSGQRVLDVGCATGYTAEVLRSLDCAVSGVEYDPDMAEQARPHLDRLEVGDVEQMDLVEVFGEGGFDAVVFGDVLEHLRDPGEVLRRCRGLLAPGGAVVASIPHIAHGAVRLALLDGRFAYTETGLLDRTHLRFFTRDAVLGVFADAGYTVVEVRRTRLGVFETEVEVREGDYDPAVVAGVLADPEATTYQFVVRAVPDDAAPADAVERLAQAEEAFRAASPLPTATPAATGLPVTLPTVPPARIALWAAWDTDDLALGLLARVLPAELSARLPGVLLRLFAPSADGAGVRQGVGEPVEPLGRLGRHRQRELAEGLDGVLVLGPLVTTAEEAAAWYGDAPRRDHPALGLATGLPEAPEVPVLWGPVQVGGGTAPTVHLAVGSSPAQDGATARPLPHPGLLAPRVFERTALEERVRYLQAMSWFSANPVLLVQAGASSVERVPELAARLLPLVQQHEPLSVVLLEAQPSQGDGTFLHALAGALACSVRACPVDAGVDGTVAAVAHARAVVATDPAVLAVAAAYDVPALDLTACADDELAPALDALLAGPAAARPDLAEQTGQLDAWLDEVAERLRPRGPNAPGEQLDASERYAAMERAHAAMRARTTTELRRLVHAEPEDEPRAPELALAAEVQRLRAELEALKNTKTMRVLRPAHDLYARVQARVR